MSIPPAWPQVLDFLGTPTYLAVCGGAAAGAQVARGAVRGAARLARGDTNGALAEAAGGLVAPAVRQLAGLAEDVRRSAAALSPRKGSAESAEPAGAPEAPATPPRRRRSPAAAINSAA